MTSPHRIVVPARTTAQPRNLWRIDDTPNPADPPIRFRFPPPIEGYQGQVVRARGELNVHSDGTLSGATGFVEAAIEDVTLGEEELDYSVRYNQVFLQARTYPTSRFSIESVNCQPVPLATSGPIPAVMVGRFELKGVTIPLSVSVVLENVITSGGRPELHMKGAFSLESLRETFDISGPSEDDPSGNRLLFEVHFVFRPG